MGKKNKTEINLETEEQKAKGKEQEIEKEVEIGLQAFINGNNLHWTVKARLEHYLTIKHLPGERTQSEWQKLLSIL